MTGEVEEDDPLLARLLGGEGLVDDRPDGMAVSGAGTFPSVLANCTAASNT